MEDKFYAFLFTAMLSVQIWGLTLENNKFWIIWLSVGAVSSFAGLLITLFKD